MTATAIAAAAIGMAGMRRRNNMVRRASGDDSVSRTGLNSMSTSSPEDGRLYGIALQQPRDERLESRRHPHAGRTSTTGPHPAAPPSASCTASVPGNGRRPVTIS